MCEFLIEQGADVNRSDPDTAETPLHAALCTPNRPAYDLVVQVLVARGADPNLATRPGAEAGAFMRNPLAKGETPLHRAAALGSEAAIQRLIENEARSTGSASRAHERAQIPRRADLTNRHPTRAIVDRYLFETNDLLTKNYSDSRSALRARN
jgi:ankyrin repeat protein